MLKLLKLAVIFFIFYFKSLYADENIYRLNSLYLDGILDQEVYLSSLGKLGINTNSDNFDKLFSLFKNKVLDNKAYSNSLGKLITTSEKKLFEKENEDNKSQLKINNSDKLIFKKYKVINCKGNSDTCAQIKSEILPFEFYDDKVHLTEEWLDDLIKNELSFVKIANLKTFKKKDKFDILLNVFHSKGLIINFVFSGYIDKNDFHMEGFKVKVDGIEESSGNLSLIY
tara:strand:+ start:150 stop:830 length:681 start_codon:yes stop_codon:yes gene_type:complete